MNSVFDKIYILHYLPMKDRDIALQKKFAYLGLKYEYVYAIPFLDIFEKYKTQYFLGIHNGKWDDWEYGVKGIREWSIALGHYMCVYQAYQLGYNNILILENDIVINTDKQLMEKYLSDVPEDADIIRYGYMSYDDDLKEYFDKTNELFYKDNENNNFRYYGNQCYGLMNRKVMEIYLDSCNYCFNGNEDVENIHRGNKYNLNIYYATKPLFIDPLAYNKLHEHYIIPYSDELMGKYKFME